jgi:hypothetical protein
MDFAGGIWAFWDILVPSTALSIQEFKKRSQEAEFRSREMRGKAGCRTGFDHRRYFEVNSNQ